MRYPNARQEIVLDVHLELYSFLNDVLGPSYKSDIELKRSFERCKCTYFLLSFPGYSEINNTTYIRM